MGGAKALLCRLIRVKTLAVLWLTLIGLIAGAIEPIPTARYSLSVGRVFESAPERPEWVYILGNTSSVRGGEIVCRTPAGLKALIKGLPRGSTLDWWPTCAGESNVLTAHLADLKKICASAGVVFTIHPAG